MFASECAPGLSSPKASHLSVTWRGLLGNSGEDEAGWRRGRLPYGLGEARRGTAVTSLAFDFTKEKHQDAIVC